MPSESVSTRSMVAPGYLASAAAFTLAAVVPVRVVSPECPVVLVELEVPVAASAVPVAARTAPPPKPASTRALAASTLWSCRGCGGVSWCLLSRSGRCPKSGGGHWHGCVLPLCNTCGCHRVPDRRSHGELDGDGLGHPGLVLSCRSGGRFARDHTVPAQTGSRSSSGPRLMLGNSS